MHHPKCTVASLCEEAISELRRAGEDMAQQNVADDLANAYEFAKDYVPDAATLAQFVAETCAWYQRIPIKIEWCYDKQPFETAGQMRSHCKRTGILLMYAPQSILGTAYHKHRAVHDWFGHVEPNIPFGIIGELASYRVHKRMYSPNLLSLIFSDVVLNNAYFEAHGQFFASEKYTLITDDILQTI